MNAKESRFDLLFFCLPIYHGLSRQDDKMDTNQAGLG